MRGFAQAHNAWRVLGEASDATSGSRTLPRLTPFFARQAEFAILAERWHSVRAGKPCTVLVVGEAGIGKSRLIEHFLASQIDNSAHSILLAGSALHEDSALYPMIAYLRSAARLQPEDPRECTAREVTVGACRG